MNTRSLLLLLALTAGCTHGSPSMAATHAPLEREHGTQTPEAATPLATGSAIALLEALLVFVRDADSVGITRCFAQETLQLAHPNVTTRIRLDLMVQRVLAARHAGGLPQGTTIDTMIDLASLQTTSAGAHFPVLPTGLRRDDIVVSFRVLPLAERALLAIALRGQGRLIIRVTSTRAEIVAL